MAAVQLETPPRPLARAAYRRLVVCLSAGEGAARAVSLACRLADERHSLVTLAAVVEVPLEAPLDAADRAAAAAAREAVHRAQAVAEAYGVAAEGVVLHARDAGEAIVHEVTVRRADVVVVAAEWPRDRRVRRLDDTTDHVLKHAPCRVLLIGRASSEAADSEPVFRSGRPGDYWPAGAFVDRA